MALDSMKEIFERSARENIPFWEIVLQYDMEERQVSRQASMAKMLSTWQAIQDAADSYTGTQRSVSGLVGGDGLKMRLYARRGESIGGEFMDEVIVQAISMAESNACMRRIVAAPMFLCSAGSHGDLSQGFARNPLLSQKLQQERLTLGAGKDYFVNAVREQVKYGSDFLKIMATGGFFTPYDTPIQQQLNDEELKAIMDTAHALGKTVTAHVYTNELMQKLIAFGIDGMEHGSLMNRETAQLIEEKGLYLVPTFCPYEEAVHYDPEEIKKKQPEFRRKLELYKDALQAGREVICSSKIKLGYGTDFVANHQNYESGYEYEAWLNSGMDPFAALKAATSVNADILQLSDKIGTIEPGKYADISAWKRDLMHDTRALLDCAFVMKEGKVYDTESCLE